MWEFFIHYLPKAHNFLCGISLKTFSRFYGYLYFYAALANVFISALILVFNWTNGKHQMHLLIRLNSNKISFSGLGFVDNIYTIVVVAAFCTVSFISRQFVVAVEDMKGSKLEQTKSTIAFEQMQALISFCILYVLFFAASGHHPYLVTRKITRDYDGAVVATLVIIASVQIYCFYCLLCFLYFANPKAKDDDEVQEDIVLEDLDSNAKEEPDESSVVTPGSDDDPTSIITRRRPSTSSSQGQETPTHESQPATDSSETTPSKDAVSNLSQITEKSSREPSSASVKIE